MSSAVAAELESEAIYVIREALAQFQQPVLLFSGGKDSIALAHLIRSAVWPAPFPVPLLHVDTGHNFPETLEFRDRFAAWLGAPLWIASVEELLRQGELREEAGPRPARNSLQSATLLKFLRTHAIDACLGGARRDEERARAKERFFSHRNAQGGWEPRRQRPELWDLLNGSQPADGPERGHFRIFPLNNWTELDVWRYLQSRDAELPSLYFAHHREVIESQGTLLAVAPCHPALEGETVQRLRVRFRTLGDIPCSGAIRSRASNLSEILRELESLRFSERSGRADDQRGSAAMERRKREGYF